MLEQLQDKMKSAMKAGDKPRLMGLRNLIGKLKAKQIDKGEALTEEESLKILQSAAKQLRDSVEQYKQGGRDDLAEKESFELSIAEEFLPTLLSEAEVTEIVKQIVSDVGAQSMKDMGKVMGVSMKTLAGKADGKIVQTVVRNLLS